MSGKQHRIIWMLRKWAFSCSSSRSRVRSCWGGVSALLSPSVPVLTGILLLWNHKNGRWEEKRMNIRADKRRFIAVEVRGKWAVLSVACGASWCLLSKLQPSRRSLLGQCLLCPIPLIPHSDSGALEGWITLPTVTMANTVLGGLELARTTDRNSPGRYYTGKVLH